MATTLYCRASTTGPLIAGTQDMLRAASSSTPSAAFMAPTNVPSTILRWMGFGSYTRTEWQSERLSASATISGTVTVTTYAIISTSAIHARLRINLYKRTAGGSAVDTLIGSGDSAAVITTTQAQHTVTITPAVGVVVSPNERLIIEAQAVSSDGLTIAAGDLFMYFDGTVANTGETTVVLTETLTFLDNLTPLYLRSTQVNALGSFYDLILTPGASSSVTSVVAVKGVPDVQWTASAEGCTAVDLPFGAITDTSNTSSYVSGTVAFAANRLYLLAVVHSDAAAEVTQPTISAAGAGLTFVNIGSVPFDTIASNLHRLTVFRALKTSAVASGTITVNFGDASTGCLTQLTEVSSVVTTGTDGADAVRNIVTGSADAGANPAITLGAFAAAKNGTWACFASDIATAPTAGTGFTSLAATNYATPTTGLFTEWQQPNDTSADCTLASSDWAGLALELVATAPGVTLQWITPRFAQGMLVTAVADAYAIHIRGSESNIAANATMRVKLFRWRAGVETEFLNSRHPNELPTSAGAMDFDPSQQALTEIAFLPDDRLVLRVYLAEAVGQTLGSSRTASMVWNFTAPADASVLLRETPVFKAESDPAEPPPPAMTLGGVG